MTWHHARIPNGYQSQRVYTFHSATLLRRSNLFVLDCVINFCNVITVREHDFFFTFNFITISGCVSANSPKRNSCRLRASSPWKIRFDCLNYIITPSRPRLGVSDVTKVYYLITSKTDAKNNYTAASGAIQYAIIIFINRG